MTTPFTPQLFGRYYLTARLGQGGMGEVFKARFIGADRFEKLCVIKRILPQFAHDPTLLTMLSDEAQVAVQLSHSNVVQVFDFGQVEHQYYLSMEFVDGVDLAAVIREARHRKQAIPPPVACAIIADVCRGLDYAHRKTDLHGMPLRVVHRDVSPQNILLSFEGEVKVTDFGIAKAATNLGLSLPGSIRGKLAYMSPEQAAGQVVDARSDIFSTAVVLYELLTLRPFFHASSDTEFLERVRTLNIAQVQFPPEIPPAVAAVLRSALHQDPVQRTQHAADMEAALRAASLAPALAPFVRTLCRVQYDTRQQQLEPPLDATIKSRLQQQESGVIVATAGVAATVALREQTGSRSGKRRVTTTALASSVQGFSLHQFFLSFGLVTITDFLKPLVAIAPVLLSIFAMATVIYYFRAIRRYLACNPVERVFHSGPGKTFAFMLVGTVIWTLATVVSFFTPARGVIASEVASVANLQETLFRLSRDVTAIRATTDAIATGVRDLQDAVARLHAAGGAIAAPRTSAEWYHNARYHELEGRHADAADAYVHFLLLEPGYLDAHEAYQQLLRRLHGEARAEVLYREALGAQAKHPLVRLMTARFLVPAARHAVATDVLASHKAYAPAYYEQLKAAVDSGLNALTAQQWRDAKVSVDQLQALEAAGKFRSFFLDRSALQQADTVVQTVATMYDQFGTHYTGQPMRISADQSASAVSLTLMPQEGRVVKIWYRLRESDAFEETGFEDKIDSLTGLPAPVFSFPLALEPGHYTLQAKYVDTNDAESPVVSHPLDVLPFSVGLIPQPGEQRGTSDVHVHFRGYRNHRYTRFLFSLDHNRVNLQAENDRALLAAVPRGDHTLYVRAERADGTYTETHPISVHVP